MGGNGYTSPSDKLSIASIGCGGKGRSDIINASVNGRENVVALCDIDPSGNHGVIDVRKKFPKAKFYTDFRELISQEKDLDVDVKINSIFFSRTIFGWQFCMTSKGTFKILKALHNPGISIRSIYAR